jgi:hypothetical protein
MPSFKDVLRRVEAYFQSHRAEIDANAERLIEALNQSVAAGTAPTASAEYRQAARLRLGEAFDAANGGFGGAPKFPHPAELGFLLRALPGGDAGARRMVSVSLTAMAAGGLYDHLGGGFFRYSVDAEWRIPHFEKMLYDNAALLGLYSEAYAATGEPLYRRTAGATADWLLREMRDANGGFYATLDADSEGEEGKFYLFTREDFAAALTQHEREAAETYFGLDRPPNFEGEAWHLQTRTAAEPAAEGTALVESARAKLLAVREARPRPGRDEKELTSWNGLAISALARAARHLQRTDFGEAAAGAADFLRAELWRDGRLKASYKDGRPRFDAYLDDYAFLLGGLIELMQWHFRPADLELAIGLADCLLERFADPAGGFFFTADDHERLIHRPKPLADEAVPSGNGVAAVALDTLGHLLGEARFLDAAKRTVEAALAKLAHHPEAHASLLRALDRRLEPPELLIVRGDEPSLEAWRERIDRSFAPERLCFFIAGGTGGLPGLLESRAPRGAATAYLCKGTECLAPIDDLETLLAELGGSRAGRPFAE